MFSFVRKQEGTTAIEFGLIVMPLTFFLMGIVEIAIILFINSSMEAGVIQASRYAITGSTTPGLTREQKVVQILEDHAFGLVNLQPSNLTTLVYPNFSSIGQAEPFVDANSNGSYDSGENFTDVNGNGQWDSDMGLAGLGGPGDIVVYRVDYQWGLLTDLLKPFLGNLTLTNGIAVRNEPY